MQMTNLKGSIELIVFFLIIVGFVVFGMWHPELYLSKSSIPYVVSFVSILLLFIHIHSNTFESNQKKYHLAQLTFGFGWRNVYQFSTTALVAFVISLPSLIEGRLVDFVILFSSCYFQSLIIHSVTHIFYKRSKRNLWHAITGILTVSVIVADKVEHGFYLLFNPLVGLSYIPYWFNFELSWMNVLISAGLSYVIVFLCILVEVQNKKV